MSSAVERLREWVLGVRWIAPSHLAKDVTALLAEHDALLAKVDALEKWKDDLSNFTIPDKDSDGIATSHAAFIAWDDMRQRADAAEAQVQADRALIEEAAKVLGPVPIMTEGLQQSRSTRVIVELGWLHDLAALLPRLLSRLHEDERAVEGGGG